MHCLLQLGQPHNAGRAVLGSPQAQVRPSGPRGATAPGQARSDRPRVHESPVSQPRPEAVRLQQAPKWLVECQCPGRGGLWVVRLCQEQPRTDRAVV